VSIFSQSTPQNTAPEQDEYTYKLQVERLRAVMNRLTDPIFAIEPDGTIFFFSEGASNLIKQPPESVEGRKFTLILPFEPKENLKQLFTDFIEKRVRVHTEIKFEDRLFMAVLSPLLEANEHGTLLGGLIELKDLSEKKRLEKMQVDFVSIISHELRTPISSVKGYLNVLLDEATYLTDEHKEFLKRANSSNDRQEQTVERLLDLSNVEQGNIEFHISKLNLDNILRDVVKTWHDEAYQKGLQLKFIYPKFAIPAVSGDEQLIRRVFNNLIGNAVKYTQKGSITIKLSDEHSHVSAYVADTGPGIQKDLQEKVFDKFIRGENTLTESTQGSGLGLYLARKFVEIMGGTIKLASEVDKGTAFKVTLPYYKGGNKN